MLLSTERLYCAPFITYQLHLIYRRFNLDFKVNCAINEWFFSWLLLIVQSGQIHSSNSSSKNNTQQ